MGSSLVALMVKNPPAMQETRVRSLGQEDPLEKGMATHSSILAWRIPWTEETGRLLFMGSQRVRHDQATNVFTFMWIWAAILANTKEYANHQTIHSSPMLVKLCLKSCMLGFSIMQTKNFQMSKLGLEKAEEPEIKLPTSTGSWKKQEFQTNISFCFIDYAKAFDCVDHNKLWKILKEMGITDLPTS